MEKIARAIVKNRILIYVVMFLVTILSALLIPRVPINYELADYLPEDSETAITLRRMEEEYGETGVLFMMIKDVHASDADGYANDIEAMEHVESVSFDSEDEHYYSDFNALYSINLTVDNYAPEAGDVIDDLNDTFADEYGVYFDGPAYTNLEVERIIGREMPIIVFLAVAISLIILTLSARSYVEPFIFLGVVSIAIVINLGTNIIFDDISYITRSVAAVLQLGLSMDYSIMLLNRYHETLKDTSDHEEAMIKALSGSFRPITASSMTTVAGMIALMFMSYGIGFDIGSVLAKGILLSLISVFVLMPGLLVTFTALYERFKKRSMAPRNGPFLTLAIKMKKAMPFLLFALVIGSFALQVQNEFRFTDEVAIPSRDEVRHHFSQTRQVILIYDDTDDFETKEAAFLERLEAMEIDGERPLLSRSAITTTALQRLTIDELETMMEMDEEVIRTLFGLYAMEMNDADASLDTMQLIEHLYAMRDHPFLAELNENTLHEDIEELYAFANHLRNAYNYEEAAAILDTDDNQMLALYYAYENEDFDFDASPAEQSVVIMTAILFGEFDPNMTLPFDALIHFIHERIEAEDIEVDDESQAQIEFLLKLDAMLDDAIGPEDFSTLADMETVYSQLLFGHYIAHHELSENYHARAQPLLALIDDLRTSHTEIEALIAEDVHEDIDQALSAMNQAENALKGEHTRRMIFTFDLPAEGPKTAQAIESMRTMTYDVFEGEASLAGEIISTYDIEQSFYGDYILIALITVGAIFVLVFTAFRNLLIPIILVFVIQGAIWLSMGINVIMGTPLFFLSYLMVIAIQMGATVDYGILITSNYLEQRERNGKYEAMREAINQSLPTVFTSGMILITAGLSVGFVSSISSISEVGILLGRGATISIVFVTIILPSLLLAFDAWIFKTMLGSGKKDDNPDQPKD